MLVFVATVVVVALMLAALLAVVPGNAGADAIGAVIGGVDTVWPFLF